MRWEQGVAIVATQPKSSEEDEQHVDLFYRHHSSNIATGAPGRFTHVSRDHDTTKIQRVPRWIKKNKSFPMILESFS